MNLLDGRSKRHLVYMLQEGLSARDVRYQSMLDILSSAPLPAYALPLSGVQRVDWEGGSGQLDNSSLAFHLYLSKDQCICR